MVPDSTVRLALPKGRMADGVRQLLQDAEIRVRSGARAYRPSISLPDFEVKTLKPQNIVEMLSLGSRDVGFAGADWVNELDAKLIELLDTTLDPVKIVAAVPETLLENGELPSRALIVASEYEQLTKRWISERGLNAAFVRTYGATEVFPPEDADCIVDNTATGKTLQANNLRIIDTLMLSSTRLYANPQALNDRGKREAIEHLVLLLRSVLEARSRVMLELNVSEERLTDVIGILPCMREPTIAALHNGAGFAVKAAVPRLVITSLIPQLKSQGGTDIVISKLAQIIP